MSEMQTPYYLIEQDEMDENFVHLCKAMNAYWPNNIIGYSYKTNAFPWLVKHFQNMGCFAEVVSKDEYELSKLLGIEDNRLIYNGPVKSKDSFEEAVKRGCIVNIDSHRELDWIAELVEAGVTEYKIGLRVNFDIEKHCPGHSACGSEGGRFGFCYENGELKKALDFLSDRKIKVSGLHLHTSSKSREVCIYDAISKVATEIAEKYSLKLEYVDIGGGFFGGLSSKPQFEKYFEEISENLKKYFRPDETTLIAEPGMAIVGAFIRYVTQVTDIKDTNYNRFVITDGSRTNIDPLMTKTGYDFEVKRQHLGKVMGKQVISGYTCMEHDRLFDLCNQEEVKVGDEIIYNKVGAYTMCLTPLFISYFPDVYVENANKIELVRSRWTAQEYLMNSI